jgi:hypothetical protein
MRVKTCIVAVSLGVLGSNSSSGLSGFPLVNGQGFKENGPLIRPSEVIST